MSKRSICFVFFIVCSIALSCCKKGPKAEFESWWKSLSPETQEVFLHQTDTDQPWIYKVSLSEMDVERSPDLVEFKSWVESLTPGQIEAFERYKLAKVAMRTDPDITKELMQSKTIRADITKESKNKKGSKDSLKQFLVKEKELAQ